MDDDFGIIGPHMGFPNWANFELESDDFMNFFVFCDSLHKKRLEIVESIIRKDFKKMSKRKPFNTLLHLAVMKDDICAVEYLLNRKASIKFKNKFGDTPLHIAVKKSDAKILNLICSNMSYGHKEKTNINPMDMHGLSHMHIVCISRNSLNNLLVQHFLDQGVSPNLLVNSDSVHWPGYTPLHFAVEFNNKGIVEILLQNGADVSIKDADGCTALHIAFLKSGSMVELLLKAHESFKDNINPISITGLSHFHIACTHKNASIVQGFIDRGADINAPIKSNSWEYRGYTPLHMAVHFLCEENIALLMKLGASITATEGRGLTPLHLAYKYNNIKIVKLMLSDELYRADSENATNEWNLSHFHIACMYNKLNVVKSFLKSGVSVEETVHKDSPIFPGYTALHFAAAFEKVEVAELLLQWNARVDAKEYNGFTPLHIACQQNLNKISNLFEQTHMNSRMFHYELKTKLSDIDNWFNNRKEYQDMITLLLKYKSDIDCRDFYDRTPMYHACEISPQILELFAVEVKPALVRKFESTRYEMVSLLLKNNADIFTLNECTGKTVLYHLIEVDECLFFTDKSKVKIVEMFLSKGVDVNVKNSTDMTPLHLAVSKSLPSVVELLLKNKAEVNTAEEINLETPLHKACQKLDMVIAKQLLNKGADVNARKRNGRTALHEIVSNFNFGFSNISAKATSFLVRRLLEAGCDVNVEDYEGKTPLHVACSVLNYVGAHILLQHGADINAEDQSGKAPLSYCLFHCRGNFNRIYYSFFEHIIKIQRLGFYVSNKNHAYFVRISKMDDYIGDEGNRYLAAEYTRELLEMKTKKIGSISFYDMFYKDANQLAVYAKNKTFVKIVTSKNFPERFPFFGYLLKLQYKKGCARLKLMKAAKQSLESLTKLEFPGECAELIFYHLRDQHLKQLIAAKDVVVKDEEHSH